MSVRCCSVSQDFFLHEKLGSGTYGDVFKGVHRRTNQIKAVKIFKMNGNDIDVGNLNEISILKSLNHPNIIEINNIYVWNESNKDNIAFTMPIARKLTSWARSIKHLPPMEFTKNIESVMRQLTSALVYLHSNGFIHQDIKPNNILVDDNSIVKLIDFGISHFIGNCKTVVYRTDGEIQTLNYRAPELLHAGHCYYNTKIDSWSLGCVFTELLSNSFMLFPESNSRKILKAIKSSEYKNYIHNRFPDYSDILLSILHPIPEIRLSIGKFARKIGVPAPKNIRKENLKLLINHEHPIKISKSESNPHILNTILKFLFTDGYNYRSFAGAILLYRLVSDKFAESEHVYVCVLCSYVAIGVYEGMQISLNSVKQFLKKIESDKKNKKQLLSMINQILMHLNWRLTFSFPTDFIDSPGPMEELLTLAVLYSVDYTIYPAHQLAKSIANFTQYNCSITEYDEFLISSLSNALDMNTNNLFGPAAVYPKEFKKILSS